MGLGVALTAGLIVFDQRARRGQEQEALAQQAAHANELASELGYQIHAAEQLLDTLASLAGPLREQREVEELLRRVLPSAPARIVHGIGVWFEPGRFEPGVRYMGPYLHHGPEGGPLVLTYEWSTPAYDYPRKDWYQRAWQQKGRIYISEPYFDMGLTYVSLVRAFFDDEGQPRGVVSVDITLPLMGEVVREANVSPTEILYFVSRAGALIAHPRQEELLTWARGQGRTVRCLSELTLEDLRAWEREAGLERGWRTAEVSVARAGWRVFVSTEEDALFDDVRRQRGLVVALGLLLWAGLGASGMVMARSERNRILARTLAERQRQEEERRRLLAQVQRRSAELQAIIESMVEAVIVLDPEGTVTLANRAALALFGKLGARGPPPRHRLPGAEPQGIGGTGAGLQRPAPLPGLEG
ncbi:PAS domain-containing protein [Archangium gephyra]|uniref:cache domain-containing protein n=1 Tax=Archangium gephyra TaxID=48 RepID=UPI003B7CFBBA